MIIIIIEIVFYYDLLFFWNNINIFLCINYFIEIFECMFEYVIFSGFYKSNNLFIDVWLFVIDEIM